MEREFGLKVVDAFDLDAEVRSLLRPYEMAEDKQGRQHRLPRYFYEVPTHEAARAIRLTASFGLNEFLLVDLKEAHRLRNYPRYVPCAVRLLAFYLQRLREAVAAPLHIAVNGGYRSPAHKLSIGATPHMWGTAIDLYRVGSVVLRDQHAIETYNRVAEELSDDWWVMPYGHEIGKADDHMHLDLGFLSLVPREINEDRLEVPQQVPRFAFEERRRGDRRGWPADTNLVEARHSETTPGAEARRSEDTPATES
ncbi:MAG TPA: hypothetical protein VMR21_10795 [Vicinamibacteria bacterium]|nr:hypothetical protein [Vicinamibacteria bacterium]